MANSVTGVRNIQERSTGANKHNDEGTARDTRANQKNSQWPTLEQCEEQKKTVLNYNPKYNINIHRSLLILVNDGINKQGRR